MRADCWNDGFVVVSFGGSQSTCRNVLEQLCKKRSGLAFGVVYKDFEDKEVDPNRCRAPIPQPAEENVQILQKKVLNVVKWLHKTWTIYDDSWSVLLSKQDCDKQALRREFSTPGTAKGILEHNWVQASVVLVLESGTKLQVYPGCIGFAGKGVERQVSLLAGQIILLRGDLAWSGSALEKQKYHMHCCVTFRGIEREYGVSEEVAWRTFLCRYCSAQCFSLQHIANHITKCEAKLTGVAKETKEVTNNLLMASAIISQDMISTRASFGIMGF